MPPIPAFPAVTPIIRTSDEFRGIHITLKEETKSLSHLTKSES